jgi:hypothetical protein
LRVFGTVVIFEVVVAAVMMYGVVGITTSVRHMVLAAFAVMMPAASRYRR